MVTAAEGDHPKAVAEQEEPEKRKIHGDGLVAADKPEPREDDGIGEDKEKVKESRRRQSCWWGITSYSRGKRWREEERKVWCILHLAQPKQLVQG
ncbi:hypothetical protein CRG98_021034 [Punica granatum]|uniref:Uncharacterized protein n=1 Tax=Punica granatum TaxID=22663 RepID=A0A2I0JQP9_PUNGR|nr:hypothetical protein CRG98_021034 [Punica granatum]